MHMTHGPLLVLLINTLCFASKGKDVTFNNVKQCIFQQYKHFILSIAIIFKEEKM